MNLRTLFWAVALLPFSYTALQAMQNNPQNGPTPFFRPSFMPPRQPSAFTTHMEKYFPLYLLAGMGGVIGIVLYADYKIRANAAAARAKVVKKENKKTLELGTFTDQKFLKALKEFVDSREREYQQEKTLILTTGTNALALSQGEKAQLLEGLVKLTLAQPENKSQEYEASLEYFCVAMKSYFGLKKTAVHHVKEVNYLVEPKEKASASYKDEIKLVQALLWKGIEQLTKRLIKWGDSGAHSEAGIQLLEKTTNFYLELEMVIRLISYVQLQEIYVSGKAFIKEEIEIAQKMNAHEPFEEALNQRIHNISSPNNNAFPYVMYEKLLDFVTDRVGSLLHDCDNPDNSTLKTMAFQKETLENCRSLIAACAEIRAYLRQQAAYKDELRKYEKKEAAERKEAEQKREKQALENELASIKRKLSDIQSQPRYFYPGYLYL